jgi:hypothetical protein
LDRTRGREYKQGQQRKSKEPVCHGTSECTILRFGPASASDLHARGSLDRAANRVTLHAQMKYLAQSAFCCCR